MRRRGGTSCTVTSMEMEMETKKEREIRLFHKKAVKYEIGILMLVLQGGPLVPD